MLFCGIDLGTTNSKAVLLDEFLTVVEVFGISHEHRVDVDRLDADVWMRHFNAVLKAFARHFKGHKVYLSLTTQGGSFVLLDSDYRPVDKAWLWTGQAPSEVVTGLGSDIGCNKFYRQTGWQPLSFLMPCKFRNLHNFGFKQYRHIATVPDYITSQLVKRTVTDVTNAQITGFFDFINQRWSKSILKWADCELSAMSSVESTIRVILDDVKTLSGKVNLVTSSHDQYAAMEAADVQNNSAVLCTGTAWVLNGRSSQPIFDETYCIHPGRNLRDGYGSIITLGPVGQRFERLLYGAGINIEKSNDFEKNIDLSIVPDGAVGLNHQNSIESIRDYMWAVAAIVLFNLHKSGMVSTINKLVMTGGATASSVWPQIIANMSGLTVETVEFPQLTAYGAALMARQAVTDEKCIAEIPGNKNMYYPEHSDRYRQWYNEVQKEYIEKNGWTLVS